MATRIYEVPSTSEDKVYLVEAQSRGAAEKYVAGKYVGDATVPNGKRLAELMGKGVKVEVAA